MLLITLSLLATTYAQSVEYSQYGQKPARVAPSYVPARPPRVAPIDLTDEIYSSDFWSNPNAQNIIYNFAHVREDQPPHVEAREESLGGYLYRPKPSTTTSAPVKVPEPADIHAQVTDVHWYENQQAHKTRVPTTTAAPLPDWQDTYEQDQQLYSRQRSWSSAKETEAQYPNQLAYIPAKPLYVPTQSAYISTQPPHVPDQPLYVPTETPHVPTSDPPRSQWADYAYTTTPKPRTWSDPILGDRYKPDHPNPKPTIAPLIPKYSEQAPVEYTARPLYVEQAPVERTTQGPIIVPSTATAPVWEEPKSPSAHSLHRPRNSASRGSHKYVWSEDNPTEAALVPSTTVASVAPQSRGPPPPVPTLTPWYGDKF